MYYRDYTIYYIQDLDVYLSISQSKPRVHGRMDVQIDGRGYILVLLCDNGNQTCDNGNQI